MEARRQEFYNHDTGLVDFSNTWTGSQANGGTAEAGSGASIPNGASGWTYGHGDLFICSEIVWNNSAAIPASAAPVGGTGTWAILAESTGVDSAGRGVRHILSWKRGENGDSGTKAKGMTIPLTNALGAFRYTRIEGFYMSRPIRNVVASDIQTVALVPSVTTLTKTIPLASKANDIDFDLMMGIWAWQGSINFLDSVTPLTPAVGSNYRNRRGAYTADYSAGLEGSNTFTRLLKNRYSMKEAGIVDMTLDMTAKISNNMTNGIGMILKIT